MGHAVGVHDPGHYLRVGVNIRRRDVFIRRDQWRDFVSITSGKPLEFVTGKLARIANNAALCAAEWDIDDGTFPRHPHRQGLEFIESNVRVITNTPLARPASAAMLHAETFKHADRTIIHFHRKRQRQRPTRAPQDLAQTRFEAALLRGIIELAHGDSKGVEVFFDGSSGSRKPGRNHDVSFRTSVQFKPRRRAPYPVVATLRRRSSRCADARIQGKGTPPSWPRN